MRFLRWVLGTMIVGGVVLVRVAGAQGDIALNNADRDFVQRALQGGYAEVVGGKLALSQGTTIDIQQFGERMVQDHSQATMALVTLARQKGLATPPTLSTFRQAKLASIGEEHGVAFDKAYVTQLAVDAHVDAIKLFEQTRMEGQDPDIKAFVLSTLPMLQAHLESARQLQQRLPK